MSMKMRTAYTTNAYSTQGVYVTCVSDNHAFTLPRPVTQRCSKAKQWQWQ